MVSFKEYWAFRNNMNYNRLTFMSLCDHLKTLPDIFSCLLSCSASVGDLCHRCSGHPADSALLPVYLHQMLLQREKEEEIAEG